VGLVAALAAVWTGSRREWLRVTFAAGACFVLLGCLLFGRIAGAGWDVTQTLAAPGAPIDASSCGREAA
jgi:hypothetical protein